MLHLFIILKIKSFNSFKKMYTRHFPVLSAKDFSSIPLDTSDHVFKYI